jgi:hypothetical protein
LGEVLLVAAIAVVEAEGLRVHEFDSEQGRFDFTQFGGLVAAYEVNPQCVVVETTEGREIRITVRRDLMTGRYVSDYERRSLVTSDGNSYQVWAHTPAYQTCRADDLEACLEAALLEVNRVHVY